MSHQSSPNRSTPSHPLRVALVLLAVLFFTGCGERSELVVVDSEKEANRILVVLAEQGIAGCEKKSVTQNRQDRYLITAPPDQRDRALRVLVERDLPSEQLGGMEAMIENAGLIPTRTDERARLMHAISGELSQTLQAYDRITHARVHVVLPEEKARLGHSDDQSRTSATVLIKYTAKPGDNAEVPEPPVTNEEVCAMVANSVEGLKPEDVFVGFTPSKPHTVPVNEETGEPIVAASGPSQSLVYQLYAAVAGLGLLCVLLIFLLLRKGKGARG